MVQIEVTGLAGANRALRSIERSYATGINILLRVLSARLRDDVRKRMSTADGGQWVEPSKWIRAKKNSRKALSGLSRLVRSRVSAGEGQVYFDSPGDWTLTQHHDGFQADLIGPKDKVDTKGRVILTLLNPKAIGVSGNTFGFRPKNAGQVPARKIWPTDLEANSIAEPIVIRWANERAERAAR